MNAITADISFRREGWSSISWDAWTGNINSLSRLELLDVWILAPREARIFVSNRDAVSQDPCVGRQIVRNHDTRKPLMGHGNRWCIRCSTTASVISACRPHRGLLGPQARRFRYSDEVAGEVGWQASGFR